MPRSRPVLLVALLLAAVAAAPATAAPLSTAVIGDTPYGPSQLAAFPGDVRRIDADAAIRQVVHLGDIKSGGTPCTDAYYAEVRGLVDGFQDPLAYTPGDNEWTDCSSSAAGRYLPTERLAKLRTVFFPVRGRTLGAKPLTVSAQPGAHLENTRWHRGGIAYALVHLVGSNNGGYAWYDGLETVSQRAAREEEVRVRTAAALDWIDTVFRQATSTGAAGVVLGMQADTWTADGAVDGFATVRRRLRERVVAFKRPVVLLQGDSHLFRADNPYGAAVPNLTRLVVQGDTECPREYLRLTADRATAAVFRWQRMTLTPTCP